MDKLDTLIDTLFSETERLHKAVNIVVGLSEFSDKDNSFDIYSIESLVSDYATLNLNLLDYCDMNNSKVRINAYKDSVDAENIVRKLHQHFIIIKHTLLSLKRDMKEHNIKKGPYSDKFCRIDIMITEIGELLDQQLEIAKNMKNYYYKNSYEFNGYC